MNGIRNIHGAQSQYSHGQCPFKVGNALFYITLYINLYFVATQPQQRQTETTKERK